MTGNHVIVVGAGSVGCVVAMRLARDFGFQVTLCEPPSACAPPEDRQRPARWLRLFGSAEDYRYATQPHAELAGRSLAWPRGRGLGGSSRINAMIWHEPTPADLAMLAQASGGALDPATLQNAVAAIESLVQPETPRWLSPSGHALLDAMRRHPDSSHDWLTVYRRFNRSGQRWTAADLIERSHHDSTNSGKIDIVRGIVDRVVWQGDRAVGVRLLADGVAHELRVDGGVVLCAGAIATPTILVRSGIGPRETLDSLSIPHRCAVDAIGSNLQDHLVMPVIFESPTSFTDTPSPREVCRWQVSGTGSLTSNVAECGGLVAGGRWQLHVTPTHYLKFPQNQTDAAMTIAVNATRPQSRGKLRCTSTDPTTPPHIDAPYMTDPADMEDLIDGVEFVRQLAAEVGWSRELLPGVNRSSREALAKSIQRYSQTLYHPVGTCAMGSDPASAVQPDFRVRHCEQLWIADASILPVITQGNPSVTLMSLGWIAAQAIAGKG